MAQPGMVKRVEEKRFNAKIATNLASSYAS